MTTVRVGLLGCGNVGGPLVRLVRSRADAIEARTGIRLEISRIAVRSLSKDRGLDLADGILTTDAAALVSADDVDLVVEVMGTVEPARTLVLAALDAGKPVVTANKELVANVGAELFEAADRNQVDLLFEAAVGGGIPFIRPLRESLAGEHITRVMGIVNGTTNFILTKMTEAGADYGATLAEAQQLGYAEPDPTADVEGHDAAAKAAIIATIAFGQRVVHGDVYAEGISRVSAADIAFARQLGYVIKLLAVIEAVEPRAPGNDRDEMGVAVRVHPVMIPDTHPLASVRDSFNAVFVEGAAVGDLMFYGRGAGGDPTASAVLGDVIDAAVNLSKGAHGTLGTFAPAHIIPIDEIRSQYYLNIDVVDQPGVLATVAGVLGQHGVSIRSMEQEGLGDAARLVFITHVAREADMQATLHDLRELDEVGAVHSMLRVLG